MDTKLNLILLMVLVLIPGIYSQGLLNDYEYIKLEIENTIEFDLKLNSKSNIKKFEVDSFFFPQTFNGSQYLNSYETNVEENQILDDGTGIHFIRYYMEDVVGEKNEIINDFVLESTFNKPEIKEKVEYPLEQKYVDATDESYLEFEGLIDIDDEIRDQASALAEGESDVYIVASKVAKWIIEDVEYDLSTVLENPNQKSTEVYQSKTGVCREITNLYISMMRSLGIPARVVTGFSYTTSEDVVEYVGSNWGGHAWAEVLIGDTWVPFDLTYNQYGFVDATHVVTDKHSSLRTTSVSINGTGYDFSIVKGSLKSDPEFEVLETKNIFVDDRFDIEISGPEEIGFTSYGFVELKIQNLEDNYEILFLNFAKPSEINLIDPDERMLIFRPNEEKRVYFRYQVPDLESGFIYTFPISVYNAFIEENFNISVREDFEILEKLEIESEDNDLKDFSDNELLLNCGAEIKNDHNLIDCTIKNPNNYEIQNLRICADELCQTTSLRLNEQKSFVFRINERSATVTYEHNKGSGEQIVAIKKPDLQILDSKIRTESLSFDYAISRNFEGLKLIVKLNEETLYNEIAKENQKITLPVPAGEHKFNVMIQHNGDIYEQIDIKATIPERTTWEKFVDWFLGVIRF